MTDTSTTAERTELRYPFAFAKPELIAGKLFGIRPDNSEVVLDGDEFIARFGPWTVATSIGNIAGADLTGPYSWPKIIGPAHLSLRDSGLTFASNDRQGVCIKFRKKVTGVDALGIVKHAALTVTVADAPSLAAVLHRAAQLADEAEERAERHPGNATLVALDADGDVAAPSVDQVLDEVHDDLLGMSARELRDRAKELGVSGVASMKKDELIEVLSHGTA